MFNEKTCKMCRQLKSENKHLREETKHQREVIDRLMEKIGVPSKPGMKPVEIPNEVDEFDEIVSKTLKDGGAVFGE